MKRIILTAIAALLVSAPAYASFANQDCSSSDGSIRYEFRMRWDMPKEISRWIINNVEYADGGVTKTVIGERSTLETYNGGMGGWTVYAEHVNLKYIDNQGEEQKRELWLLCSSSGGI